MKLTFLFTTLCIYLSVSLAAAELSHLKTKHYVYNGLTMHDIEEFPVWELQ